MSTLILDVNKEQELEIEILLSKLNISYQKINQENDFWDDLPTSTIEKINIGLKEAADGKFSDAKEFIKTLIKP
jgi:CTP:phosphocholine cytidylyltransferase-like protein